MSNNEIVLAASPFTGDTRPTEASAAPQLKRARPVDYQWIDEVHIRTEPRYKTSGASGNEWRFAAVTQLKRKGKVVYETTHANVESAVHALAVTLNDAENESMKPPYDFRDLDEKLGDVCDQEGCSASPARNVLRIKREHCTQCFCDESRAGREPCYPQMRRFCDQHATRGDCSLNDADTNYELVSGTRGAVPEAAVAPAASIVLTADSVIGDSDSSE